MRGLDPGQCASWVQAWGSIIAIIISVFIAVGVQQIEAYRARAAKLEDEIRILRLVGLFVFEIRAKLREIDDYAVPYLHDKWTALDEPVESLKSIPLIQYPSERPAFIVATSLTSYRFLREARDSLGSSLGSEQQERHIDRSRQHARDGFFKAELELQAELKKRKSFLEPMRIDFESGASIYTLEFDPVYSEALISARASSTSTR